MKLFPIWLIIFWLIIVYNPDIIAYLLWWLLIFIWLNILIFSSMFNKKSKKWDNYVKFGNYKIFR